MTKDRPLSSHNFHTRNISNTIWCELPLPANKLPQIYAFNRAATGIGNCGVKSFKVTLWEWRFDSELGIVIEQ
jgi:hypothetical protein